MRLKHSKLTHIQTNKLLDHCVAGTPARTTCLLAGVNKITATQFCHRLRVVIAERLSEDAAELAGAIDADESYFGRVGKGRRGRGAAGKVPVFGLMKRGGRVFVLPVRENTVDALNPASGVIAFFVLRKAGYCERFRKSASRFDENASPSIMADTMPLISIDP